jgi:nitrate reductase NapAB chaperone NapD
MSGLHVSGVLVRSQPERISQTQEHLESVPGVDVCTTTPEGHIVTVIERDSDAELTDAFHQILNASGVLSASLVYHYSDKLTALDEEVTS